jgi:glycosyltransferase involved in cell wall biosynthesis
MENRIIITHQYPPGNPGGGTKSCLDIAKQLEKLGQEVILIFHDDGRSDLPENYAFEQVYTVPRNSFHHFLSSVEFSKTVKRLLKEQPVDAVLSWGYEGAFLPRLLKTNDVTFGMIAAKPSYREWLDRKAGNWMRSLSDNWFRCRLFKVADVVYVSSNYTHQEMVDLFQVDPKCIEITYRGIDDIFLQVERSCPEKISNFIFYGSFDPVKGVFDVISALGKVASQGHKNWHLKLAGWGYEDELKNAIREQGIEEQVVLLGTLTPQELAEELEWSHLAILPSRAESFGRAIAEAQAAGLAVISYETGSVPEVVEQGITGLLVPPQQIDLLSKAVIQAIQDPKATFQMGLAGRAHVISKFSWEFTANKILDGIRNAKLRSKKGPNNM